MAQVELNKSQVELTKINVCIANLQWASTGASTGISTGPPQGPPPVPPRAGPGPGPWAQAFGPEPVLSKLENYLLFMIDCA